MTENKRYEVEIYDEKAVSGYCVLDKWKPSQTARVGYKNVFISTKEGCDIVCDLLNEQDKTIKQLREEIKDFQDILSRKEEELLKPVIRMIDDLIDEVPNVYVASVRYRTAKQLENAYKQGYKFGLMKIQKELKMND